MQVDRGFVLHRPLGNWQSTLRHGRRHGPHDVEGCPGSCRSRRRPAADVFVSLGYAGWEAGPAREELAQNAWLTVEADPGVVFDLPPEERLPAAVRLLGIEFRGSPRAPDTGDRACEIKPDATILAFDFGTRRIGVAMGNTLTRTAHPLTTIADNARDARLDGIAALIEEWRPAQLVVGLPTHADGTPHAMTARAQRFARQLDARFGLPVALVDERWTTEIAQGALRAGGRGGRDARGERDAVAAQIILQAWFDAADEGA